MSQPMPRLSADKRELLERMLQRKGIAAPSPRIPRRAATSPCPASTGQARVWAQAQRPNTGAMYHVVTGVRLTGPLDRAALHAALDALAARHEILRTSFVRDDDGLWQVIRTPGPFALRTVDLRGAIVASDDDRRAAALHAETVAEVTAPFDLVAGPPARGVLIQLADDDCALVLTVHRIACDGWSKGVFARELAALYSAHVDGRDPALPALELQYGDYAAWQRDTLTAEVRQRGIATVRQRLAGARLTLDLPTDLPRAPAAGSRPPAGGCQPLEIAAPLVTSLRTLARQQDATLFMILFAGWTLLMSRLGGQRDVVVGSPMANRPRAELEALIGTFVNQVPLRAQLRDDMTVAELIEQVKDTTLAAYANQWVPFDDVVAAVAPRDPARTPIFQSSFMLLNTPQRPMPFAGLTLAPHELPIGESEYELSINLQERGDAIAGVLFYAAHLFAPDTVVSWLADYQALLAAMVQRPSSRLRSLPVPAIPASLHLRT